ncbi:MULTISPECIES: co-regulatory protein PtrA N-terminal domain-containing protein [Pseudomonas]|jgi:hypothetical protein|uniref:Secreted protein n=1 Tax=Pseudomonas gingeri TaxID=117681 RepID=A0A7Y7WC65_9PSED|nr:MULTISPECIES: co-regulatory protein PtrA N-terminal domain-containing protein [Pseudomonas]MCU1737838.1 hypothetical protein [Pseudomonas sp. 20S_6.2_Bac1]NWB46684.1 hypothetical protein [Pseudomonas gingeri]
MKSLKALLIVTLMTASVAAMAEGGGDGGDKVMARMDAARDTSMAYYQQSEKAQAVAAEKSGSSNSIERTN